MKQWARKRHFVLSHQPVPEVGKSNQAAIISQISHFLSTSTLGICNRLENAQTADVFMKYLISYTLSGVITGASLAESPRIF